MFKFLFCSCSPITRGRGTSRQTTKVLFSLFIVALALSLVAVNCDETYSPTNPEPEHLITPSLTLNFRVTYPANLFYVIDQVSQWDYHTHVYYRSFWDEEFGFSSKDNAIVQDYKEVRQKYTWGKLEPIFFSVETLDEAWREMDKAMSKDERETIKETLLHFQPKFSKLWDDSGYLVEKGKQVVENITPEMRQMFDQVAGFYSSPAMEIDVMLILNPAVGIGGGYNGGRIAFEIGREVPMDRLIPVLFHEVFHAFQETHEEAIEKLAAEENVDYFILHESPIYSLSPGIFNRRFFDQNYLADQVKSYEASGSDAKDSIYLATKLGLALIPLTEDYLKQGRLFSEYLKETPDIYRSLNEDPYLKRFNVDVTQLEQGQPEQQESQEMPTFVFIGKQKAYDKVNERFQAYIIGINPDRIGDNLDKVLKTPLIIAFEPKNADIPSKYRYLLPMDYDEMRKRIEQGESFTVEGGTAERPVILFAAPDEKKLLGIIEKYDFSKLGASVTQEPIPHSP